MCSLSNVYKIALVRKSMKNDPENGPQLSGMPANIHQGIFDHKMHLDKTIITILFLSLYETCSVSLCVCVQPKFLYYPTIRL